ncbi:MAG: ion channel [Halarcobacter ebronensis]
MVGCNNFTTVGYGDMYPVTTVGRILTTIVSILGIAFYAILEYFYK